MQKEIEWRGIDLIQSDASFAIQPYLQNNHLITESSDFTSWKVDLQNKVAKSRQSIDTSWCLWIPTFKYVFCSDSPPLTSQHKRDGGGGGKNNSVRKISTLLINRILWQKNLYNESHCNTVQAASFYHNESILVITVSTKRFTLQMLQLTIFKRTIGYVDFIEFIRHVQ